MVQHEHGEGEYNIRCMECEERTKLLSQARGTALTLRDLQPADLPEAGQLLPEKLFQRVRHVVTENERVRQSAKASETDDLSTGCE